MRGRRHERIEAAIDHVAAATLAGAVAFALLAFGNDQLSDVQLRAAAAVSGLIADLIAFRFLRGIAPERRSFAVRAFTMADFDFPELDELLLTEQVELVLTDADRLHPDPDQSDELVLDDVIAKLSPDSRVVRLFDPATLSSPGQLSARIDQHLRDGTSPAAIPPSVPPRAAPSDASKALYQALAELRRSLR